MTTEGFFHTPGVSVSVTGLQKAYRTAAGDVHVQLVSLGRIRVRGIETSNRALICFDPRGLSSTTGSCESGDAQLIFSSADKVDTVRITALGKVLR